MKNKQRTEFNAQDLGLAVRRHKITASSRLEVQVWNVPQSSQFKWKKYRRLITDLQ